MPAEWRGHGMSADADELDYGLDIFAFMPEELTALADHCRREAYVWEQVSKYSEAANPEKTREIAEWWKRRALKWTELSALCEQSLTEEVH